MNIITKKAYAKNMEGLNAQYEAKKAEICETYKIKANMYDLFAEIIANEDFKKQIPTLAKNGADEVEGSNECYVRPC